MDEEITIIDSNTRNEKIKNFFINNKKNLIIRISIVIIELISYLTYENIKEKNKIKLANKYNLITIDHQKNTKQKTINELIDIINENDNTYSPLALYFLLDNNLIKESTEANKLFDELIFKTNLKKEIKT